MLSKVSFASALLLASADVYLHTMRGSNNRCDEKNNNRNNANRGFNSQNNAAGGYGVCDSEMHWYVGTMVKVEYYSQHSCGNGEMSKDNPTNYESTVCQQVIQLGCENTFDKFWGNTSIYGEFRFTDGISLGRPGAEGDFMNDLDDPEDIYDTFGNTCTDRHPQKEDCEAYWAMDEADRLDREAQCNNLNLADSGQRNTFNSDTCECTARKMKTFMMHEPNFYWDLCSYRERNKGLFVADQKPNNGIGARATRQQPQSQRYGFECPEERDYYPYWAPTPWVDLAVLVSDIALCDGGKIAESSQNVQEKCWCMPSANDESEDKYMMAHKYITRSTCESEGGYEWQCMAPWSEHFPGLGKPHCGIAPSQPDNRLGNTNLKGIYDMKNDDTFAHYDWFIPEQMIPAGQDSLRCVLRLRYNISTGEIVETSDARDSDKLKNNPVKEYGEMYDMESEVNTQSYEDVMPLRMAINTAQFGRTFEDRSYIFEIRQRPNSLKNKKIHNVGVRGKRGNIAQVRNCVEYDFVPLRLVAAVGDYVHFQWCGTNYNNNGNAGEGRAGTDRSNVVQIGEFSMNLPQPMSSARSIFSEANTKMLAWLNQTECYTLDEMLDKNKKGNQGNDPKSCHFLNGVRDADGRPTSYFNLEPIPIERAGNFGYMSSRNNNFSNRSQKAVIAAGTVGVSTGVIAGIVIVVVVVLGLVGVGAALIATGKISLSKSSRV